MNTKQLQTTSHELSLAWKRAYKHGGTAENNDILVAIEAAQAAVQAKILASTSEIIEAHEEARTARMLDALLEENSLTQNEYKVLDLSLNYADRASQLSDNYSNFDVQFAKEALGINAQAVGGVVSSLVKKGYMMDDGDMVWLTDSGVNAVFNVLEAA